MNINIAELLKTVLITTGCATGLISLFLKKFIENKFNIYERQKQSELDKKLKEFEANETRRNLKSTSYVNIITHQRIEWLELVRKDFSKVVSYYRAISYHNLDANNIFLANFINFNQNKQEFSEFLEKSKMTIEDFFEIISKKKSDSISLIEHITLLKLRMNPEEDEELINLLCKLENDLISSTSKTIIEGDLKVIEISIQKMLKSEWEKVKKEVILQGPTLSKPS